MGCQAASVVFLNPGRANETFWVSYTQFMQAAASDLGMSLQVRYGERDTQKMLREAREVLQGTQRPDYLIFVNENYAGPEILRLSVGSGVRLFAVNSTLTADQQRIAGASRGRYPNWIGSLVADDEAAGYLMAKALLRQGEASGAPLQMLAFSGSKQTPASQFREQGMRRALAEYPQARLLQLVYAGWANERAYEQGLQLLKRYPQTRLVWSANDEMAFGAMRAAKQLGRVPGKDLLFSALNNSPEMLDSTVDGRVSVAATGHFSLGAWAMVLLHDYDAGVDFATHGGKDRQIPIFVLLDRRQAARMKANLARPGFGIDFRDFSLALHPERKRYEFSVQPLLR
ncbi:ABC transporter substrate-binding protein [Pseudomonas sp. QL9]|uniref:ABC-type sugar transport system, periplasmic component n=1 Tax=Pseudomonas knackmussii (strain DSM 6978 / CCUG 54928 / LMG 23759 / B13) TaxID=1301098 RepID=A0A024HJU9_PSEKB|nr:ABC transporter substrate-binding protein [Pseudomonas knackmussii]CDF84807.1 ABC-type sugar transport system, periplasmic component [Pseudomonas knackmussii B13]